MTTPSLEELYTPQTTDQVLQQMLEVAAAVELPVDAWQSEGVVREVLYILSTIGASFSQVAVILARLGLLDYASGAGLTLLAKQLYDVDRVQPTNGTTTERLSNSSGTLYTIAPGDLRFYNLESGATYTNTSGGTLSAGFTLEITIQADLAGAASNANVDQIQGIETPLTGVTATNTLPLVGLDGESDASLRTRCRESLARLSPNGPRDAYNYFAKTATKPDGTNVGVTRTAVTSGNGSVQVYVASASGDVTGSIDPYGNGSDLDLVNRAIQENVVPTGLTATVTSATPLPIAVTATVYLAKGSTLDSGQATTLVQSKLIEYFRQIPIGGYNRGLGGKVFREALTGQIFQASPQFIEVTLVAPATDVDLDAFEVATLDVVNVTAVANIT